MKNFFIGSVVTFAVLIPVVIFISFSNNSFYTSVDDSSKKLSNAGNLSGEIFKASDNCLNEISSAVGAISSECSTYESLLDEEFMEQVREASRNVSNLDCAKNLPTDLNSLNKKIEGNKAKILIEGEKIVEGEKEDERSMQDLQVEFIKTENDWEISDIRCLN